MKKLKAPSFTVPLENAPNLKSTLFWIVLTVLLGQGSLLLMFAGHGWQNETIIMAMGLAPSLAALALTRFNWIQTGATVFAVGLIVMATILATLGQGIYDLATMSFPAILIIISLILRKKNTFFIALLAVTCLAWLVFGDLVGIYQPDYPSTVGLSQFIIAGVILLLTMLAVQVISNTLHMNAQIIEQELQERKKAESALSEAEEMYRALVEETSVITYRDTAEPVSQTMYISPQIEKVLGYSLEEWKAEPTLWTRHTHPDDLPRVFSRIEEYLKTGEKDVIEYRMRTKNGNWVWFQDESVVVVDEKDRPKYIHGVLIDITQRKQAELEVKQREAILSAVADTAQRLLRAANWQDEINNILLHLGEATGASHVYIFQNHLGLDEVMLSSIKYEWTAAGMRPELHNPVYQNTRLIPVVPGLEDWYKNLSSGKPFYGSGQQYPRYWNKVFGPQGLKTLLDVPIYVNNEFWGIIGFDDFVEEMRWSQAEIDALMAAAGNLGTAISRQRTDTSLRASEEKFQLAFHHTFVPMIISRADDQTILDVNEAFCKGSGYNRAEVLGRTAEEIQLWAHAEDRIRHQQVLKQFGVEEEFKAEFRRKSGEIGVALISGVTVRLDDELCLLHTIYDISKIDELLRQLQAKNNELQNFTYTVSHDLRAPLITISGFLGYLNQDLKNNKLDKVQQDVERIGDAVGKMDRLLRELLELSRIGRMMNPPEDVPFAEIVRDALHLLEGRLAQKQIQVRVQAELPSVHGDRVRLVEVVQNLVDNAAKFMDMQVEPQIEIGSIQTEDTPVLFIKDNGIGIEPLQQERVFDLFHKLDARSEGTGIGLALVKRIVEVHGGKIWIESQGLNRGTTFFFTLGNPAPEKRS